MKIKKGIILAGGNGSRMSPFTNYLSKHLMPIYNKPMIYYPISNFIQNGIRDILIISDPINIKLYKKLLGKGKKFGVKFQYKIQKRAIGLPEAFIIGEKFISNQPVALNLGDHILFGPDVNRLLYKTFNKFEKTTIFAIKAKSPSNYGVISFDYNRNPKKIFEKPNKPKSKYIIVGIYAYTPDVIEIAKKLKLSKRNELEISELNNIYIKSKKIIVEIIDQKKNYWFDAGDAEKLLKISNIISNKEKKNKKAIACLEEIALNNGYISKKIFKKNIPTDKSVYTKYLKSKI